MISPILESLFNYFIKKKLQHRCFPANISKFVKNTYFEEHLRTAVSNLQKLWRRLKCLSSSLWQNITVLVYLTSTSLERYSLCADVLIKTKLTGDRYSEIISKKGILENLAKLKKTPLPESLFNKVSALQPVTSLKRGSSAGTFLQISEIFKSISFLE